MIERLVEFCVRKRLIAILVACLVAGYGTYAWTQLKLEAYPEIGELSAQVTTQADGLAAEEIEQQITTPLERELSNTPNLLHMRSSSTFGLSLITMLFRDGTDDYWIRDRLRQKIAAVELPSGIAPDLSAVIGPVGEIYRYTLESDSKNLMELSDIQQWIVMPALKSVPGVADIGNFGGLTRLYQLTLDPVELQRYNLGLNDVVTAINNNSANAGGGRLARGEQSYVVRGIGQIATLEELGNIVVTQRNNVPILVRDLGKLEYGHQEREGILGKDYNPDTIEGIVELLKTENAAQVLKGIHAKIAELNNQLAPRDIKIVPYIDRDDLVNATVSKVAHTILEGVGLVLIVLILFLGSPRSAVVVAVTIPLALVVAFILMNLTRLPANLLSLGSIDFGVIVDGAIVVVESLLRRREAAPERELDEADVVQTLRQVTSPIFFATLIIITAYVPLLTLEHAEGKLFAPIAYTVAYALFGALLCALLLVPGLAFIALRKPRPVFHNPVVAVLEAAYHRLLDRSMAHHRVAYAATALAFVGLFGLGATIGREFLPDLDEGALWLQVQMPTGLSLDKASEMASDLRRAVLEFPEVSYVVTQLGRSDDRVDAWTPSHIEAPVGLTPYDTWPAGATKKDFIRRLKQRLSALPGITVGMQQPISDMVNDLVGGAHAALVVKVFGSDFKELRRIGNEIVDVLNATSGTTSASIFEEPPIPQIAVKVDRAAIARYGINVSDVASLIQTGVAGNTIGTIYVGDRTYGIAVRFPERYRNNPAALGDLQIMTSGGMQVPLSQIASVSPQNGESTIAHEGMGRRALTVRIDYADRSLSSYLAEAQQKVAERVSFDPSYHLEWGGQFEAQGRATARLALILVMVISTMLLLLLAGFGKLRHAILILSIVPLAALGGLVALKLTGELLNVATGIGFIALFGVAVQNGIIMVANLNRVRETGLALRQAVLAGARERFRPVLMTSTVATVGMLPAALATGVGSDVQRGLATVIVGGLVVATALTLVILPTLYFAIERVVERRAARHAPSAQAAAE
jgi:cobalt-zinc-cadmium resistance protein CzcA